MIHRLENRRLHVFLCVFHSTPAYSGKQEEWINDTLQSRKYAIFGGPEYENGASVPQDPVRCGCVSEPMVYLSRRGLDVDNVSKAYS